MNASANFTECVSFFIIVVRFRVGIVWEMDQRSAWSHEATQAVYVVAGNVFALAASSLFSTSVGISHRSTALER